MRKLVYIVLFLGVLPVNSQNMSFRQVDTSTWNSYTESDWETLLETGKIALKQGINYYYLQMRMAYAYFSLENYRKAIPHYKSALDFNSRDHVANEFLYYSYLYSGREADARWQTSSLSEAQKKAMEIKDFPKLNSLTFNYNYGFSNADSIQNDILTGLTFFREGIQKTSKIIHIPEFSLSLQLSKNIALEANILYVRKQEFSYVIAERSEYLSPDQYVNQFEYNLALDYRILPGLSISPGIHFIRTAIPIFAETDYGSDAGLERTPVFDLISNNRIYKLRIDKEFGLITSGLSWANYNFSGSRTNQMGLHFNYYPFGNLNLYFGMDHYLISNKLNDKVVLNYLFKCQLGTKLHKYLWLEGNMSAPDYIYHYDVNYSLAYNDIQVQSIAYGLTLIIPFYKTSTNLTAGYYFQEKISGFFSPDDLFNPENLHTYKNHIFKIGMKWKL